MHNIIDRFHQAMDKQQSVVLQYNLVKTVLDHYPLDKPLGQEAMNVCTSLEDRHPSLRLLTIGKDDKAAGPVEEDQATRYESAVEAVVEFSAYGLDLTMLLKQSGLPQANMDMRP